MAKLSLVDEAIGLLGKEAVEAIEQTGKANKWNRSRINQEIRNSMKGASGDRAINEAILTDRAIDVNGQMTLRETASDVAAAESIQGPPRPKNIPEEKFDIEGQLSLFPDSTGQMHTVGTKTRQINEARNSRPKRYKFSDDISEGPNGQMTLNDAMTMQGPPSPKNQAPDAQGDADIGDIDGQMSFTTDKYGNLTNDGLEIDKAVKANINAKNTAAETQARYEKQYSKPTQEQHDARQEDLDAWGKMLDERDKANRGWRERTIDDVKERASGIWNTVSGKNYKQTTADRRAYNDRVAKEGGGEFIKSNAEYKRMQEQYGKSKADTADTLYENMQKAQETSTQGMGWDGIPGWMKVAGAATAGLIAGSVLLDDDDY